MQRLTLDGGIPDKLSGSIVALGNFDGFGLRSMVKENAHVTGA